MTLTNLIKKYKNELASGENTQVNCDFLKEFLHCLYTYHDDIDGKYYFVHVFNNYSYYEYKENKKKFYYIRVYEYDESTNTIDISVWYQASERILYTYFPLETVKNALSKLSEEERTYFAITDNSFKQFV